MVGGQVAGLAEERCEETFERQELPREQVLSAKHGRDGTDNQMARYFC